MLTSPALCRLFTNFYPCSLCELDVRTFKLGTIPFRLGTNVCTPPSFLQVARCTIAIAVCDGRLAGGWSIHWFALVR